MLNLFKINKLGLFLMEEFKYHTFPKSAKLNTFNHLLKGIKRNI